MTDKKTTREITGDGDTRNWMKVLLDGVFGSIQSFVDGSISSLEEAAHAFTEKLAYRTFLFFLALIGFGLLFLGFVRIINILYGFSGIGEVVVGTMTLTIALVLYLFSKK